MARGLDFLLVAGGMMVLIGFCMAAWPRDMCTLSQDADGKPIRPTLENVWWMRAVGIAFVVLGGLLIWAGLAGVRGADDAGLI